MIIGSWWRSHHQPDHLQGAKHQLSYNSYKAGVERARAALQAELTQANLLRNEARLPTRDIESELERQHPLVPEEAWTAQHNERKAFASFMRERLAGEERPSLPVGADWERGRAIALRRAFLENQIKQAWLTQPHARLP